MKSNMLITRLIVSIVYDNHAKVMKGLRRNKFLLLHKSESPSINCRGFRFCIVMLLSHLIGAFAFDFVEDDFAQTYVVGGYLNILVFLDVFEGLFEAEYYGRNEFYLVV